MAQPLSLHLEPAKHMALKSEAELLRSALARNPDNAALREKLAFQHIEVDDFEAVIELLAAVDPATLSVNALLRLAKSYYARRTPAGDVLARAAAGQALAKADAPDRRALAMADMSKADLRARRDALAEGQLREALALDPHCSAAFRRLSLMFLRNARQEDALALADEMWRQGVHHARIITTRTLALAGLGRIGEARAQCDLARQVRQVKLPVPEAWSDLASFNRQLTGELFANKDRRYEAFGVASQRTYRVDTPRIGETPAISALLGKIAEAVAAYAQELEGSDHPWAQARPAKASLKSWAVHPDADGFERWHLHPSGWMSGGYYVAVPDEVSAGTGKAGCIAFGLPGTMVGEAVAREFGEMLLRPQPGSLILFPSNTYHRTYPHGAAGERICLAFDIVPG